MSSEGLIDALLALEAGSSEHDCETLQRLLEGILPQQYARSLVEPTADSEAFLAGFRHAAAHPSIKAQQLLPCLLNAAIQMGIDSEKRLTLLQALQELVGQLVNLQMISVMEEEDMEVLNAAPDEAMMDGLLSIYETKKGKPLWQTSNHIWEAILSVAVGVLVSTQIDPNSLPNGQSILRTLRTGYLAQFVVRIQQEMVQRSLFRPLPYPFELPPGALK